MPNLSSCAGILARIATAATLLLLGIWLVNGPEPARAARIFKRGRPPIYPYYYNPGRPGGYSFYFGFVPYEKGDYGTQAIQRAFPEVNYPPSMRYWTPRSAF